ncbi:hypothetical protein ACFX2I_045422 [Malus domestica]
MDVPQIPYSYTTNPNFHQPQIYSPASYQRNLWVFDSKNRLRFNDPHQVSPYELDLCYNSTVHTAPSTAAPLALIAAPASLAASSEGLLSTPAPSSQAQPSATVPESGLGTSAPALPFSVLKFPPIRFSKSENSLRFKTLSDDERDEKELHLTSLEVVTKSKSTVGLVNKALQLVISECKPKEKIVDLCKKRDSYIREQTGNMSKNVKKKIERGVACSTCISVKNTVCHLPPLASDESVLEEGMAADVIATANDVAEVALRLVRPGRKHKDVTEVIQKVAVVLGPPPNVIVSRLGSPSSTFAYTILPSHELSSIPNSTDSNNTLPNLNGYNDFAKRRALMEEIGLSYKALSGSELENVLDKLVLVSRSLGAQSPPTASDIFHMVPFEEVPELVASRRVFISKGHAYIARNQVFPLVATRFRSLLSKALTLTNRKWATTTAEQETDPLPPIVEAISSTYLVLHISSIRSLVRFP